MGKILVDGLPWSFSDHELTTLFLEHGPVSGAASQRMHLKLNHETQPDVAGP